METKFVTATLKYFSQSGNSAFITTASNPFSMNSIAGYVRNNDKISNLEPGSTFQLPTGWKLVPMVDEDGVSFTTKSGDVRMAFEY